MTIEEKEQEIIDEFSIYDDWMDKYAYLIELGSGLEGMDEAHKTEENLIKGCQSADIAKADLHFIDEIGLTQHLSPTRSNGLLAMVKQIKFYAIAAEAASQNTK